MATPDQRETGQTGKSVEVRTTSGLLTTLREQATLKIYIGNSYSSMFEMTTDNDERQESLMNAEVSYIEALAGFKVASGISNREVTDLEGQACALTNLGLTYLENKQDEAEGNLNRGLNLYREIDDRKGEASALLGLGKLARLRGQTSQAREIIRQALQIRREINDTVGQCLCMYELGLVAESEGDTRSALKLMDQAEKTSEGKDSRLLELIGASRSRMGK